MKKFLMIFNVIFILSLNCKDPLKGTAIQDWEDESQKITFISQFTEQESYFLVFYPEYASPPLPVIFLLGGAGDNPEHWDIVTDLQTEADKHNVIIVSIASHQPYINVPGTKMMYLSYVIEIFNIVNKKFNTAKSRYLTGIGGFSMGAIGALYIASKYPDKFYTVSAMSGGINDAYPPLYENLENIELLIEIGTEDSLLESVRNLHSSLLNLDIQHFYNEFPGGHTWDFRMEHSKKHIKFHVDIFDKYR